MKSALRFRPQAFVALALFGVLSTLLTGCATAFKGPGDFRGLGDYQTNLDSAEHDDSEETEELSWRSAHQSSIASDIAFDWPVEQARLTQPFRLEKRRPHLGIDLGGPKGTPILAAEGGYIVYTGRGFRGYGNLIVVEHDSKWATLYSHLHKISVREGQYVKRGEVIGLMGRTGRASGVHLHFEIRHNRQPVNPMAYLPQGAETVERTASLARPSESAPSRHPLNASASQP